VFSILRHIVIVIVIVIIIVIVIVVINITTTTVKVSIFQVPSMLAPRLLPPLAVSLPHLKIVTGPSMW
jgi:hypothetical protein